MGFVATGSKKKKSVRDLLIFMVVAGGLALIGATVLSFVRLDSMDLRSRAAEPQEVQFLVK